MSILLTILGVIAAIIALLLIVALFVKKEYTVEREVTIVKPKDIVFDYVKYLRNQDHFNKWVMADPNSKKAFRGTDGTAGFVYAWDSEVKQVGKGEQEIKSVTPGERVTLEIRFEKPFEGKADASITTSAVSTTQTRVKWRFDSAMKYPMNLFMLLMNLPGMLGKDLEVSLTNLKNQLEK